MTDAQALQDESVNGDSSQTLAAIGSCCVIAKLMCKWEYLLRFFQYKPPETWEINLNIKVAGVMGKHGIYVKHAQRITGSSTQSNLENDRQQGNSRDLRNKQEGYQ